MSRAGELAGHTCLVGVYLLLNTGLNMTNRYVLGIYGFSFPMLLTMSHLCFSFIALSGPVLLKWTSSSVQRTSWRKQWRGLALVGTFMAMNIGLNNVSLVRLPLSLNQVLRYDPPCWQRSEVCLARVQQGIGPAQQVRLSTCLTAIS